MAGPDFDTEIKQLQATMKTIGQVLDLDGMRAEIADLGEQVAAPDLWDDQDNATRVTGRLSLLQGELDRFTELSGRLDDLELMVELGRDENDAETLTDAERELGRIHKAVESLEIRTLLSGEYDAREALVTIRSGAGGVDAADFAEMLMRMYTRWAEQHKYGVEVFDTSYAEEAGLKSATFAIHAPYAYGTLSVEAGTHRLVRISPFDNQGRRQTSFAAVEVVPVLEQTDEIEVPDEDVRVDVYRSGGPGGQSVNTTDSAVRLTHLPTGVVVSCQNEKSQLQNKASAMVVLKAKLLALKKAEEEAQIKELKGDVAASWGDQMRNYVLNPYQIVKDLRTGHESGNPQAVFDGELDDFLEAGIRWRRGTDKGDRRGLTARPSPDRVLAGTCPPSAGWVHPLGKVPMEPIDPVYGTATLLLIAAGAVALLLVLIMGLKLHAFVSLVLVSLVTAIAVGFEFAEIPDVLLFGFADTIGSVALLVAFGVMLGRLLEVTGGAQVLADTLIGRFGEKRAPFALGVAALIFGFPIFFDAGLVVFLPIILTVARRFGGSLLYYALPAAGGFAAMHAVVPPHPGPVAAAEQINADIGLTLLIGIPIAVVVLVLRLLPGLQVPRGTHQRVRGRRGLRPCRRGPRRHGTTPRSGVGRPASRPCSGCCSSRWS